MPFQGIALLRSHHLDRSRNMILKEWCILARSAKISLLSSPDRRNTLTVKEETEIHEWCHMQPALLSFERRHTNTSVVPSIGGTSAGAWLCPACTESSAQAKRGGRSQSPLVKPSVSKHWAAPNLNAPLMTELVRNTTEQQAEYPVRYCG